MIRKYIIIALLSLLAFVPFAVISYVNRPTGISVQADVVQKLELNKTSQELPVITVPVVIVKGNSPKLQFVKPKEKEEHMPQCRLHNLNSDDNNIVKICE